MRQFAAEFSQNAYETLLVKEVAIGDYISYNEGALGVSAVARKHMVTLMEDLNQQKQYKEESFYIACSLADRYLVNCAVSGKRAPCLIKLAVIATLLSAKLEQSV